MTTPAPSEALRDFYNKLNTILIKKNLPEKTKLFVRDSGPHKALYTSVYGRDVWLCWLTRPELNILHSMEVPYETD